MEETSENIQVTVLIPAYNETLAIKQVIRDCRRAMDGTSYAYEILVVDDCSTDNTVELAEQEGARVIRHLENKGSGASRKTGTRAAKGEWIVMIDADGTYPAKSIPDLLEHMDSYSQVIGARSEEMGTHRFLRTFAKETIRRLASFLIGKPIPDLNTGLRAFRRKDMLPFLYLIPDGFSCVSSMSLSFLTNNLSVKYVPITYFERIGKSHFHPVKDTYKYLLTVVRIVSYFAPLNVFMPLCLLFMGLGVLKGFIDIVWLRSLQESDIILVLTGVMMGAIGVLADLIVAQGKARHGLDE